MQTCAVFRLYGHQLRFARNLPIPPFNIFFLMFFFCFSKFYHPSFFRGLTFLSGPPEPRLATKLAPNRQNSPQITRNCPKFRLAVIYPLLLVQGLHRHRSQVAEICQHRFPSNPSASGSYLPLVRPTHPQPPVPATHQPQAYYPSTSTTTQ